MTIYDMFLMAILGHFVGDYLLQTKYMALHKTDSDLNGVRVCFIHCFIYTLSVALLMKQATNPWVLGMVFLSHYPIDRWGLGQKWLDLIGGRNFVNDWEPALEYSKNLNPGHNDLKIPVIVTSFGCIVYAVVDNTLHILLMWIGLIILNNFGLV